MSTTIKLRRDTAANWTSNNPILNSGEIGVETDTGQIKIGDGATAWASLGYGPTIPSAALAADVRPSCSVWSSAGQGINDTTWTTLGFDSEYWDDDAMHDPVTNNSRITIKTAGRYLAIGHAVFATNTTGNRGLALAQNGTTVIQMMDGALTGTELRMEISEVLQLSVGDYLELRGYQTSGGVLLLNPMTFDVTRIG